VLDDAGLAQVIPAIANAFGGEPPDIIAIDPIRNVFDGGDAGGENDNGAMLFFLSQRVERIRQAINPDAGVILAHHTKKLGKKQFEEDPFQALAGAGSLRGYYSTGMLLFRPDETRTTRQLIYELRNGAGIPQRHVDKINGEWREVDANERLVMKDYGERLDAERRRKRDAILQILFEEAGKLCRWFEVPRCTVYYRPVKAVPTLQDRFVAPIKAMIEENPSFSYRSRSCCVRITAWSSPAAASRHWSGATGCARSSSRRTAPSKTAWSSE